MIALNDMWQVSPQTEKKIKLLDTTLRDGEQAPGNAMTIDQKIAIALKLEEAGVDYIETGFPFSSPLDALATRKIFGLLTRSSVATFCRPVADDIRCAVDCAGTSNRHLLMLVVTASDLHLERKRGITRQQCLEELQRAIDVANGLGVENLAVGLEDASRASLDYLEELARASVSLGAKEIIFADTTGYATPQSTWHLIKYMRGVVGSDIRLSIHCHDDLGLAVANSMSALLAGADVVQATLGGIGERAGNTSLEQIVAIIDCKGRDYGLRTAAKLDCLYEAFNILRSAIGLEEPRTRPLFGRYAFTTAAGIHQQGMFNDPDTYEYVKPSLVGRKRELLVSRHSGRSIVRHAVSELGRKVDEKKINYLYNKYVISDEFATTCRTVDDLAKLIANDLVTDKMEYHA